MDEGVLAKLRRIRKYVFRGGFVLAVVIVAWLLDHLGNGGLGLLPQTGLTEISPSPTPPPARITTQAMQVVIREDGFYVDDSEQTIEQIVTSATQAHPAAGPAVKIVSGPDARVGAERVLELALDDAHLSWTLELSQPN